MIIRYFSFIFIIILFIGCGANVKVIKQVKYQSKDVKLVQPTMSNGGKYMFPYHLNGKRTLWIDAIINELYPDNTFLTLSVSNLNNEKFFSNIEWIKFISNISTNHSIDKIKDSNVIKKTSTLSFNSLSDMAKYLDVKYSNNDNFKYVLNGLNNVYPNFVSLYYTTKNKNR